jgi:predicted RND superfamily exporter protein
MTLVPWKKISFYKNNYITRIGGYEKEEKRPDLIIFSRKYKILLIIEAKDYLPELLKNADKIKETFVKEKVKLSNLPLMKDEISTVRIYNGLVFFSEDIEDDFEKIKENYSNVDNLIAFFVMQENENLVIRLRYLSENSQEKALQAFIPS